MSSHMTTANRGAGDFASASRSASPPSRGMPISGNSSWAVPWPRCSMSSPPDSMSQNQAAMNHPGGQFGLHSPDLAAHRGHRVLHDQGRGPAQERDRDRAGAGQVVAGGTACGGGVPIAVSP